MQLLSIFRQLDLFIHRYLVMYVRSPVGLTPLSLSMRESTRVRFWITFFFQFSIDFCRLNEKNIILIVRIARYKLCHRRMIYNSPIYTEHIFVESCHICSFMVFSALTWKNQNHLATKPFKSFALR